MSVNMVQADFMTWSKETRVLACEASMLGWKPGETKFSQHALIRSPVLDVCFPSGLGIPNVGTQEVIRFVLFNVRRHDGDVLAWELKPLHFANEAKVAQLVILND